MITSIEDLKFDSNNANLHTEIGMEALAQSVERYGIGRGILADKDGNIIAGNATVETLRKLGYHKVRVIESDGSTLIAVRRNDLDLETDGKAKGLAFADNRVRELNLRWDEDNIALASSMMQLSPMWSDREIEALLVHPEDEHEVMKTSPTQGGTLFVMFGKFRILTTQQEFDAIHQQAELFFSQHQTYHGFTTYLINISPALPISKGETSQL
jgi:hypothetical protein